MRSARGQAAAEYMGVLLLVAVITAALAAGGVGATLATSTARLVDCIAGGGCDHGGGSPASGPLTATPPGTLEARLERLAEFAGGAGPLGALHRTAAEALARGDRTAAEEALVALEFYAGLIATGPRGALLADLNGPSAEAFAALVAQRDMSFGGGETSRRYFEVEPEPGRGVVAFDFFIPSENSNGFRGDGRPEDGTDILRSELGLADSRVMIVMDFETGRGVVVQAETHMDGPFGVGGANEPRPISLNGDRGAWDNMGGIDLDQTQQIDFESGADGVHLDWDILNSISPLVVSVDGDVDFEEGSDGFLASDDFGNQGRVDRYPQIQVWQYLPDGRSREIARNDYQGGHNPVQGALPHCDMPNGPNLPTIGIGGFHVWDMPDISDGPSVPGPC